MGHPFLTCVLILAVGLPGMAAEDWFEQGGEPPTPVAPAPLPWQQAPADPFAELDTDGSGGLSIDELAAAGYRNGEAQGEMARARFRTQVEALFAIFDLGNSGELDREEWELYRLGLSGERFRSIDTDGDGVVSLEEIQAARSAEAEQRGRLGPGGPWSVERRFDRADSDGDGRLTPQEFEVFEQFPSHPWRHRLRRPRVGGEG